MKRIIYSNYNLDENYEDTKQFIMDEYPELCTVEVEDSDGNITYEPSKGRIWDFIYEDDSWTWDEAFTELKQFFKNKKCIFFGTIGRWDGNYKGGKIGDFEDLFSKAITDCDYIEIYDEDGHLYLDCSNHDGQNSYEIKCLTDKGYEYSENWAYSYEKKYDYSEQEMHRRLINCSFLSRLPYFYKLVYEY